MPSKHAETKCQKYMYLQVNSQDRVQDATSTPTSFIVSSLYGPKSLVTSVELKEVCMPFTIFNVTAPNNNFKWSVPTQSQNYTVPITPGAYNILDLLAVIQQAMNTADLNNTYALSYDPSTFKTIFNVATGVDAFSLVFDDTTITTQLGFTIGTVPAGLTIMSPNGIKLNVPQHLFIQIKEFGMAGISTNGIPFTFHVTINVAPSELFLWEEKNNYPQIVGTNARALNQLTVQVLDNQGTLVDLNGAEWSFLLKLNYE